MIVIIVEMTFIINYFWKETHINFCSSFVFRVHRKVHSIWEFTFGSWLDLFIL